MRGLSRYSIESIFLSQCRKVLYVKLLVCHIFGVAKNFMLQTVMHNFLSKYFCLRVPKIFVEEPFCAVFQKISGSQKAIGKDEEESIKTFCRNFFCLKVPKLFIGEVSSAVFQNTSGSQKTYA